MLIVTHEEYEYSDQPDKALDYYVKYADDIYPWLSDANLWFAKKGHLITTALLLRCGDFIEHDGEYIGVLRGREYEELRVHMNDLMLRITNCRALCYLGDILVSDQTVDVRTDVDYLRACVHVYRVLTKFGICSDLAGAIENMLDIGKQDLVYKDNIVTTDTYALKDGLCEADLIPIEVIVDLAMRGLLGIVDEKPEDWVFVADQDAPMEYRMAKRSDYLGVNPVVTQVTRYRFDTVEIMMPVALHVKLMGLKALRDLIGDDIALPGEKHVPVRTTMTAIKFIDYTANGIMVTLGNGYILMLTNKFFDQDTLTWTFTGGDLVVGAAGANQLRVVAPQTIKLIVGDPISITTMQVTSSIVGDDYTYELISSLNN